MDGNVEASAAGYTGKGYANIDNGLDIGMSWSFDVETAGTYRVTWRYALDGGDQTSRNARLFKNNIAISDTVEFPHSGSESWSEWLMTDTFEVEMAEGRNKIMLSSVTGKGLSNIDFFYIEGPGSITPSDCLLFFAFNVKSNNSEAGEVSYEPVQDFYTQGEEITATAIRGTSYEKMYTPLCSL